MEENLKRHTAQKLRVGSILSGKQVFDGNTLKFLEIENNQIFRVNLIANIIEKYIQEGEKKFGSITLDDATGQIKIKAFGENTEKFSDLNQGDTVLVVGLVKSWNNEIYLAPEIIKKKDSSYLLIRKLEIEAEQPKAHDKIQLLALKDKILKMIKESEKTGGIEIEKLILELKEHPDTINQEIKKLLEDGIAYEPRPGKICWLG
ncbi:MAG: OB-fold nucleic acid binding domain-containing protein [Nanoarchaeota archaeon]